MAITFGTAGAVAAGTTSLAVPHPASIAAGDLLVLCVVNKYPSASSPSNPGGTWSMPTNGQGTGGAGAETFSSGPVYCTVFTKIADGTESGDLTVTITSGNSAIGRMFRYTRSAGSGWDIAAANGADNSGGTGWSVTAATDPGVAAGDVIVAASGANDDAYAYSSQAVTQTGVTFGAATERQDSATTSGDDCALVVSDHPVSSGTGGAAPVYTMSASGSSGNAPTGATVFLRLRESAGGGGASLPVFMNHYRQQGIA